MKLPLKNIVVVGGGVIAWWAVVFLKKTNPGLNITLLHSCASDVYAETSETNFSYLLRLIGLSEQDLLQYADGNYCASQAYFDWTSDVQNYFHSTSVSDLDYETSSYVQWLLKLKQADKPVKVDDFLLASAAARVGKIALSEKSKIVGAGLSFNVAGFVDLLVSYAQKLKVDVITDEVKQIRLTEGGEIASILTAGDAVLLGDFYVDVTGGASTLLGAALDVGYDSWKPYLPCDTKQVITTAPRGDRLIPFTATQLGALGWVKNIPLRSRLVAQFIFCEDSLASAHTQDSTRQLFSGSKAWRFYPGMRQKTWYKNCLAVGESAVTFDNFSHSSLSVAAVSLKRFVDYLPNLLGSYLVADEYNRLMKLEFEAIRDFHCLHYVLASKSLTPFGELLKETKLPDSLQYRVDLFGACGRRPMDESTLIHPSQWDNIFLGFDFWPKNYDLLISHVVIQEIEQWSNTINKNIQSTIEKYPDYTRYMASLMSEK